MSTRCIIFLGLAAGILLNMLIRFSFDPLLLIAAAVLLLVGLIEFLRRRSSHI